MKAQVKRTTLRFATKKDIEAVNRAARVLRVSANRLMTDAINEKVASVLASQRSQEVQAAAG